jgi:uncharacterized protein YbjT (DUF2867 family)
LKIVVLGATGGTGREFVNQALHLRHHVTAKARSPEKLSEFDHPELEVVQGDTLDPQSVERAVIGQEAVLCALGGGAKRTTLSSASFSATRSPTMSGRSASCVRARWPGPSCARHT